MNTDQVARATAAVTSTLQNLGLDAHQADLLHNSNKVALRVLPCDVFARVALADPKQTEAAAGEISLAQLLAEHGAPAARLHPTVEPRVHLNDGFTFTFWTFYETLTTEVLPAARYAQALEQLHDAMRGMPQGSAHMLDRVAEAEKLVVDPSLSPALDTAARSLLLKTLRSGRERLEQVRAPEQLLHGEPHPGNILNTARGARFIDLETCCVGPVEFDVAHLPRSVAQHYPNLNLALLEECRRLVLAMVAAWRWDVDDEFPDGLRYGTLILELLAGRPPWPTLDELDSLSTSLND